MTRSLRRLPAHKLPYNPPLPLSQRKQVYLPDFTLTLIRTPFLPPRYASFWVPLNFNKLDMKDYLKRVYNVDVLKVRSYIEQQKITREKPRGRDGFGPWRRPMSRKKMTVEMTEPFVWPEEPTDTKPWEQELFFDTKKEQEKFQERYQPDYAKEEPKELRDLLAKQAEDMKKGKETWKPTWQALGLNYDRPVFGKKEAPAKEESVPQEKST